MLWNFVIFKGGNAFLWGEKKEILHNPQERGKQGIGVPMRKKSLAKDVEWVDLTKVCPSIWVERWDDKQKISLSDDIGHEKQYLVQRKMADKLAKVQEKLQKIGLGLKVWQRYDTSSKEQPTAIDVTLINDKGEELSMPSWYLEMGPKVSRRYRLLPKSVQFNRFLLESAMIEEGFVADRNYWWRFEYSQKGIK